MDLTKQLANPNDASAEVVAESALRLRMAGRSYRQIGKVLSLSHSRAYEIVIGRLQEIRSLNLELVEELRTLELARLDDMWRRMYPAPELPNASIDPKTAIALLRIVHERRAIAGLDVVQRNALPPADVPYTGPFDLDLLTVPQLRELEAIAMAATGLDPAMEVHAPANSPSAARMEEPIAESHNSAVFDIPAPMRDHSASLDHDLDTGYPLAVVFETARSSPTYLPE